MSECVRCLFELLEPQIQPNTVAGLLVDELELLNHVGSVGRMQGVGSFEIRLLAQVLNSLNLLSSHLHIFTLHTLHTYTFA